MTTTKLAQLSQSKQSDGNEDDGYASTSKLVAMKSTERPPSNAVEGTNDSATISKASMELYYEYLGCIQDGFVHLPLSFYFVKPKEPIKKNPMYSLSFTKDAEATGSWKRLGITKRAPLINRGYFVRVGLIRQCLINLVTKYIPSKSHDRNVHLDSEPNRDRVELSARPLVNLVILGAGFDTTWAWIRANPKLAGYVRVLEIDFPDVVRRKFKAFVQNRQVFKLDALDGTDNDMISDATETRQVYTLAHDYVLISGDLRNLGLLTDTIKDYFASLSSLDRNGVEHVRQHTDCPCIFLSECVLSYIDQNNANNVLNWAAKGAGGIFGGPVHLIMYEQLLSNQYISSPNPTNFDPFTITMLSHFEKLSCPLKSAIPYPTLNSQTDRLQCLGWNEDTKIRSVSDMFYAWDQLDRDKFNTIECFDEFEEWNLKMSHYFVAQCSRESPLSIMDTTDQVMSSTNDGGSLTFNMARKADCCWKGLISMPDNDPLKMIKPIKSILDSMGRSEHQETLSNEIKIGWGHSATVCGSVLYILGENTSPASLSNLVSTPTLDHSAKNSDCKSTVPLMGISLRTLGKRAKPLSGLPLLQATRLVYHSTCAWGTDRLVVFGGRSSPTKGNLDTWIYHCFDDVWERMETSFAGDPSTREMTGLYRHESVICDGYMYVVGGICTGMEQSRWANPNLLVLDLERREWQSFAPETQGDLERYGHSVVMIEDDSEDGSGRYGGDKWMLVVGGEDPFFVNKNALPSLGPEARFGKPLLIRLNGASLFGNRRTEPSLEGCPSREAKPAFRFPIEHDHIPNICGHAAIWSDKEKMLYLIGGMVLDCSGDFGQGNLTMSPGIICAQLDIKRFYGRESLHFPNATAQKEVENSHSNSVLFSWIIRQDPKFCQLWINHRAVLVETSITADTCPNRIVSNQSTEMIAVIGGGSVCFSMGAWYNSPIILIDPASELRIVPIYNFMHETIADANNNTDHGIGRNRSCLVQFYSTQLKHPCVLRNAGGIKMEMVKKSWNLEWLVDKIGKDTLVSTHKSSSPILTFHPRNYEFEVMTMERLGKCLTGQADGIGIDKDTASRHFYYLRSIGTNPRKDPSNLTMAYPDVAKDLFPDPLCRLFPQLANPQLFFSSVLRVSSTGVQLWIHYDVMDNVLVQICGRKRITFWPPKDIDHLYVEWDSSSSRINLPIPPTIMDLSKVGREDDKDFVGSCPSVNEQWMELINKFPLYKGSKPRSVILEPGDMVYIPALWFHHVEALEDPQLEAPVSIAVNVFWRGIDCNMGDANMTDAATSNDNLLYSRKDLYGNRDLVPFEKASQQVEAAINSMAHGLKLPKASCLHHVNEACVDNNGTCRPSTGSYWEFYQQKLKSIITNFKY